MKPPHFLFLQGVCSPLFMHLAAHLRAAGASVHKVNFNAGDVAYWAGPASLFRGPITTLPDWLEQLIRRRHISDLVLFGDCRPVHALAMQRAAALGLRVHVLEEGYFRPHWFTLERDGVNERSRLPRDPKWYRETAPRLPPAAPPVSVAQTFRIRAVHDVAYHAAGLFNPLAFPRYRTHAMRPAPVEYAGFLRRALRVRRQAAATAAQVSDWLARRRHYFLLPLQLDHDSQIREHSPFSGMAEVVQDVMRSFALQAPADSGLLIKSHPLDYRWRSLRAVVDEFRRELALGERVAFIESGDLQALVDQAAGVVTVNSTVGTMGLQAGRPVIALGKALYRMPGLCFDGPLAAFWRDASPPDPALVSSFEQVVMHATQVNGGLYGRAAIELGLARVIDRLLNPISALERLLEGGA